MTPAQEARAIALIRENWPEQDFPAGECCYVCAAAEAVFKMSDSPVCSVACAESAAIGYLEDATGTVEFKNAAGIYDDLVDLLERAEQEPTDIADLAADAARKEE
jgi:hypothetical protein